MEYNNNIQKGDTDNPEQDSMVSQETIPLTEKAEKTDKETTDTAAAKKAAIETRFRMDQSPHY